MEAGAAARGRKAVCKQARRARMFGRGTRPEHAVLGVNPFVADASVVGRTAGTRATQILEHPAPPAIVEKTCLAERRRNSGQHIQIGRRSWRRLHGLAASNDASF